MPILDPSPFQPMRGFTHPHMQTLWSNVGRRVSGVTLIREKIETPDGDFLLLDWSHNQSSKLVILSHGLEGHSQRPYMLGMIKTLSNAGFDVLAWNFRSCGGELNRTKKFYHAGATDDLNLVVQHARKAMRYTSIYLIGFSLGGNQTLKLLGEWGKNFPSEIKKAAAISVPVDLADSEAQLSKKVNRQLYLKVFLTEFKRKLKRKARLHPGTYSLEKLASIKSIRDFDEHFTAPIHGFESADHLYREASAKPFLKKIEVPTLILNAKDDPFLGIHCYPEQEAIENFNLFLEMPEKGGHLGFFLGPNRGYYAEKKILAWFLS